MELKQGSFIRGSLSKCFIYDLPALHTTTHYEVRIVFDPEHNLDDYGVVNKQTGIVEYFVNNLARAKMVADDITKEAIEGVKDPREEFMRMLADRAGGGAPDERLPGEKPKLNG